MMYKKIRHGNQYKEAYKKLSTDYKKAVSSWHNSTEAKICDSRNPASFFNYANKKLKSFDSILPLLAYFLTYLLKELAPS